MGKSDAKKIILAAVKKHLGAKEYYDTACFPDSLTQNAKLTYCRPSESSSNKVPIAISVFEGLVKLRQYMCATSLPEKAGESYEQFLKTQQALQEQAECNVSTPSDSIDIEDDDPSLAM